MNQKKMESDHSKHYKVVDVPFSFVERLMRKIDFDHLKNSEKKIFLKRVLEIHEKSYESTIYTLPSD